MRLRSRASRVQPWTQADRPWREPLWRVSSKIASVSGGRAFPLSALFNHEEVLPHSDGVFLISQVLNQLPGCRSIDGYVNLQRMSDELCREGHKRVTHLVRLDSRDFLICGHGLARLLEPSLQSSLCQGLGHLRNFDRRGLKEPG